MTTADDEELVRACRNGDQGAFGTLVDRYQRPIFNAAFRMVNDYEDARDIAQTVFLKAYESLSAYDSRFRFYSWIYRIAINESINFLGRRNRIEPLVGEIRAERRGPEEDFAGDELSRLVQGALMTLTPEYRTVIVLRHFMNCSYAEIGQIAEIPEKVVKSRLFTARQQLREALTQKGVRI